MADSSFGNDLWVRHFECGKQLTLQDNIPAIETYTLDGIESSSKLMDFCKKRAQLESDYSKAMQKLAESFKDTKRKKKLERMENL